MKCDLTESVAHYLFNLLMSICEKTLKALMICQRYGHMVLLNNIRQKTALFCMTYELLFHRNITKSLRFSLFLLGMMF